jgi:hypothetical protein
VCTFVTENATGMRPLAAGIHAFVADNATGNGTKVSRVHAFVTKNVAGMHALVAGVRTIAADNTTGDCTRVAEVRTFVTENSTGLRTLVAEVHTLDARDVARVATVHAKVTTVECWNVTDSTGKYAGNVLLSITNFLFFSVLAKTTADWQWSCTVARCRVLEISLEWLLGTLELRPWHSKVQPSTLWYSLDLYYK